MSAAGSGDGPPGSGSGGAPPPRPPGADADACGNCGDPKSYPGVADPDEKRICKRANQVLVGLLRHYSYKYYGVEDVTQANAVEVEMSSAGSPTDEEQEEEVDSDAERGWKEPDANRGWSWCCVMIIFASLVVVIVGVYFALKQSGVIKGATGKSSSFFQVTAPQIGVGGQYL